jgi:hypothetical protein
LNEKVFAYPCPLKHIRQVMAKGDLNQIAARIVSSSTGSKAHLSKNPAAVALGRLGGKKGGAARAKALSPKRRSEIASEAARKRWSATE